MASRKTLLINFAILAVLVAAPGTSIVTYRYVKQTISGSTEPVDHRVGYPTFPDKANTRHHFSELKKLVYRYKSFIGWRPMPFSGESITINSDSHRASTNQSKSDSVWFFGGSTMWGFGVSDSATIPSYYAEQSGNKVYNFGEQGYTSRQSLAALYNQLLEGEHIPSRVIFYDGYNDVYDGCSVTTPLFANGYEDKINKLIREDSSYVHKLFAALRPLVDFIGEPLKIIIAKTATPVANKSKTLYDCHIKPRKAEVIARLFATNWYFAYLMSRLNDVTFTGVLQPTAFSSSADLSFAVNGELTNKNVLESQFRALYPLIKKELSAICKVDPEFCDALVFADNSLEPKQQYFFDLVHLGPKGNQLMANYILESLSDSHYR